MLSIGKLASISSVQGLKASPFLRNVCFHRTVVTGGASHWRRSTGSSATLRRRSRMVARVSAATSGDPPKTPTIESASALPLSCREMDNSALATIGAMGHHKAREEILRRHIMVIDRCSYDQAEVVFQEIDKKNKEYKYLLSLPYQIGITTAVTAAVVSFPLVFHLPTAEWFNVDYVTTAVPEPEDLETMLECGSWTWNWMEPPLGTFSFMLLCMQFARAQIQNLGAKPYTEMIKQWRAERLAKLYPQYDSSVVVAYSKSSSLYE